MIANVRTTILIGLSTVGGAFSEPIVRKMAGKFERPITSRSRTPHGTPKPTPRTWPGGRTAASWSLRAPLPWSSAVQQCLHLPSDRLGTVAAHAPRVTDGMMRAAATALGELTPALNDSHGLLLPPVDKLRETAVHIGAVVALAAVRDGVAPEAGDDELLEQAGGAPSEHIYDVVVIVVRQS